MCQPEGSRVSVRIFLRIIGVPRRSGGLRQMHVNVGHSGKYGAVALIDDNRAGRSCEATVDATDASVFDDDRRWPALGLSGIDNQASGLNGVGFGIGRSG